jgi:phosphatidylglycerophosphate synthase
MGLLVLAQYFTMRKNYLNHISLRDMVIFTVLLIFVNYAKPNFIIAFAPAMLIFLIADLSNTSGKKFGR